MRIGGLDLVCRDNKADLKNDIEIGDSLNKNNIGLRRPGTGLQPKIFESILGKKTLKKIQKN